MCVCVCVYVEEGGGAPGIKLKFINPAFVLIQYNLKLVTSQWLTSVHVLTWPTKIMCFCYDEGDGGECVGGRGGGTGASFCLYSWHQLQQVMQFLIQPVQPYWICFLDIF